MAKYLVTGGCGFIGSHLAYALIRKGHDIVILDDLSTGKLQNAPKEADIIIGDATHYETVEKAFKDVDGCFHLAAVASVEKSVIDWTHTHTVNVTAAVNVFQAASKLEKKIPIVYASSAAVYGDNDNVPLSEEEETAPLTAYGVDKYSCELHARIAWLVHKVPTTGIRPFNIYGPRQDPKSPYSGVISIFADRITNHRPFDIHGDGEQVRDFVYVEDIVQVFMGAMEQLKEGYNVLNVCTGNPTSVNRLVDVIENICGYKSERHYAPARKGDIRVSIGSPDKLFEYLHYKPNTPLEEGLKRTIESLRNYN